MSTVDNGMDDDDDMDDMDDIDDDDLADMVAQAHADIAAANANLVDAFGVAEPQLED